MTSQQWRQYVVAGAAERWVSTERMEGVNEGMYWACTHLFAFLHVLELVTEPI